MAADGIIELNQGLVLIAWIEKNDCDNSHKLACLVGFPLLLLLRFLGFANVFLFILFN